MKLWDAIRKQAVAATPEEKVRQALLQKMVGELGFPKNLIAIEKDLASLPHKPLSPEQDPHRRLDIVCFTPIQDALVPLLLVECKAGKWNQAAEQQVLGYNSLIGAPFVCIANGNETKTLWREVHRLASVPFLPTYEELKKYAFAQSP